MSKQLLIVESPAKSKTIERFLGEGYEVMSSYGHIRDLKAKDMGVDVENGFVPEYEVSEDKEAVVSKLKSAARKAEQVWLASDEDREGEAIAWHLAQVLGLDEHERNRIVFHEITPGAIKQALKSPRAIDKDMVDAQQARRVLDRVVGFELSPVLWQKIRPSLSAGRVQSVAVRIVVEREREINAFVPKSSYRIVAKLETAQGETIEAELDHRPDTYEEAYALFEQLKGASYEVTQVDVKPAKRSPAPPFTTSTLQQEASRKLGLPVSQTMRLAQHLYESGHITYMRTDSVTLSKYAVATTCEQVEKSFGKEYVKARNFTTKSKGAQEAHEAIRPTHLAAETVTGTKQEKALYDLIRRRTMASQMADAKLERTTITIGSSSGHRFVAKGEVVAFDGFLKLYLEVRDEEGDEEVAGLLPKISEEDALKVVSVVGTERFTQRPPRYNEASLVRRLEELGIGRPSTYAPTIQTIQKRDYVERKSIEGAKREYQEIKLLGSKLTTAVKSETYGADRNKLVPTDVGMVVNDFLVEYFPKILEYNFTAKVEQELDMVSEGKMAWQTLIGRFYDLFHPNVESVLNTRMERKVGERELGVDPKSGLPVFAKIGRYGPIVQLGQATSDGPKPKFAPIPSELSIDKITLKEALKQFELPRRVGEYKGEEVEASVGRFGPYLRVGSLFVSIPKEYTPHGIDIEQAGALIDAKREQEARKQIAIFGEGEEEIRILNGRFGPYVSYKKKNYKIPKTVQPEQMTQEQALALIEAQDDGKKGGKRRATSGRRKPQK